MRGVGKIQEKKEGAAQPLLSARLNIFYSLGGELHGFSAQNLKNMQNFNGIINTYGIFLILP